MNRQKYNLRILQKLATAVGRHPEQRFSQILRNLNIITEYRDKAGIPIYWVNEFNLEPQHIVKRLPKTEEI